MHSDFLRREDICFTIHKEIAPKICLNDFEDMYREGGRPPVSPKIMVLILVLQYIERLSDRAAAHNLRYRLDWKIALGVEVDFAGIHPTTLVYFRDRLLENKKASYAFDKVVEHLISEKLIKKDAKQRIDSTHIVGNVRELSRLELLHETLRLFCDDLYAAKVKLGGILHDKCAFYRDDISTRGISDQQKATYLKDAGLTMKLFITWVTQLPEEHPVRSLKSYVTMSTVFSQNFQDDGTDPEGPKLIKVATGKDHICSPHEPESRYANKGNNAWLGYKAQVAETIPESKNDVGFLTYIEVNDAPEHDSKAITSYADYQAEQNIQPAEVYADTHYNTSDNIEAMATKGVELKGPVAPEPTKSSNPENRGFEISEDRNSVVCPAGVQASRVSNWNDGRLSASFDKEACADCQHNETCRPQPRGKRIVLRPESPLLAQRRELMTTDEFKRDMHKRNGIEGTLSGLVRGNSMRRSRYRGKTKTRLHLNLCGAAANIGRLHRKRASERANAASLAA